MWALVNRLLEKIFALFLDRVMEQKRDETREVLLVQHAQFLLTHFNHTLQPIRRTADKLLSKLVDRFPLVLWNGRVLQTLLDILQVLTSALQLDPNDANPTLAIPHTPFSITLLDTLEARQRTVVDFRNRCQEILQEAMKWAPEATWSHLQHYQASHAELGPNTALASLLHTVVNPNQQATTDNGDHTEASDLTACFVRSLCLRTRFEGEIAGLLLAGSVLEDKKVIINKLAEDLKTAAADNSQQDFTVALWRTTSLLIAMDGCERVLLRLVCCSCLQFFSEETMENTIACWQWILSARQDLTLPFMQQMIAAWQDSIDLQLGLFSPLVATVNPLAAYEGCKLDPSAPDVVPHDIWIKFLGERLEVARYDSDAQVAMLASLFHRTLDVVVGSSSSRISRHTAAIGTRFRLLHCALTLVQSDALPRSISKNVLRERIYCSSLDYFCRPRSVPPQRTAALKNDYNSLLLYWNALYADKKHLKTSAIGDFMAPKAGGGTTSSDSASLSPSAEVRSSTLDHGGWINTVPLSSNTSTLSKRSSRSKRLSHPETYVKDYLKKRTLILTLLAVELQSVRVFVYPPQPQASSGGDVTTPQEESVTRWLSANLNTTKSWVSNTALAWDISPTLAVYLPTRLNNIPSIESELRRLVRHNPLPVSHLPDSLFFLSTSENILSDLQQLNSMLTWAAVPPVRALAFFSRQFPPHPITAQYAVRVLSNYPADTVLFYIPQLVQALRYDTMGYVSEFIKYAAGKSQLLAHQLIWNMHTNRFTDEEGHVPDADLHDLLVSLEEILISSLSGPAKQFYQREFDFFEKITNISAIIKPYPKGDERKKACINALHEVELQPGCYLPSNPESVVIDVDRNSGTPMQSAAKAPYLARFKVCRCGITELEKLGMAVSAGQSIPSGIGPEFWQAAIFKVGDDVRQDMLALQVISLFKNIFQTVGLDLFLFPYRVVATSPGCGVIECVPNAKSRDQLGRATDTGLYEYFRSVYGDENSPQFQLARSNFVKSMAAYSLVGFLLQIKDRHNGNIMLDKDGRIIHIDFGFMFESSPGGNLGFEPDIKLTQEMFMVMGGRQDAAPFRWFVELCIKGYLAVRPYREAIVSLVSLMLDTGLPCFRGNTIRLLRTRFSPNSTEKEAANYMMNIIRNSCKSGRTVAYDWIQYYQNQIPC
ncbi:Phosphatidylinositol 3-/4-kinase catalytic domain [Trinorchestia longiramus]|nr:Phosphatidylinositol 3-/4-kinase catalytic domain [Trinorchestia longiramus]